MEHLRRVDPAKVDIAQAAWNGLDDVGDSQIPMIASWWLAHGLDSAELRELAGLGVGDGYRIRQLLPRAMTSLGYGIEWKENLIAGAITGPVEEGLAIVQRDLDAADLNEYRISLFATRPDPDNGASFVVTYKGEWMYDANPIAVASNDLDVVVVSIAASAQDQLVEYDHILWPLCATHDRMPRPQLDDDGRATWWCRKDGGHRIARIGELGSCISSG